MAETVLNRQEQKLETGMDTERQNQKIKKIVRIVLYLIMIALTVFIIHLQHQNNRTLSQSTRLALSAGNHATMNYRTYVARYKDTKIQLDETTKKLIAVNQQLDQVTAQLVMTKGMLSQTQALLSSAQEENVNLKQELGGLDKLSNTENVQDIGALQNKIETLRDRDTQVSLQLEDLKNQLRAFEANFSDPVEGKSLLVLFQHKIKEVKARMRHLNQEAFASKIAAQKEKDRLATLNGNSGFLVHNGQLQNPDGTKKSFDIDVKIVQ